MNIEEICFAKVKSSAKIPSKIEENAGYDIYACFDEDYMIIPPFKTVPIPTGIASAFSSDYYFQLEERGSTGVRSMKKGAGVIDSGFRDEWLACIYNGNNKSILITKQTDKDMLSELEKEYIIYPYTKAIIQAVFLPVPKTKIIEKTYEELLQIESERGLGKLGSSGK